MKSLEMQVAGNHYRNNGAPRLFLEDGTEINLQHYHITKWFLGNDYALGCSTKYLFRIGKKNDPILSVTQKSIQDLEKAQQYIAMKIEELQIQDKAEQAQMITMDTYDPLNDEPEEGTEFTTQAWAGSEEYDCGEKDCCICARISGSADELEYSEENDPWATDDFVTYAVEGDDWAPCDCTLCVDSSAEESTKMTKPVQRDPQVFTNFPQAPVEGDAVITPKGITFTRTEYGSWQVSLVC